MRREPEAELNAPTYVRLRERLREDIVSGVWPLGGHVKLSDLSAHYRVSGNPIREALLHLEGDGIVQMRMHRGAVIPEVQPRFVENIYDLNGAIAVMLVREAAKRLQPHHLETIERQAEDFERAAAGDDTAAAVAANRAFHRAVNGVADNEPATDILRGRLSLIDALRVALDYRPGRLDEIVEQHREIVEALRRRSGPSAARAVANHVRSAKEDLLARMKEKAGSPPATKAALPDASSPRPRASNGPRSAEPSSNRREPRG